MRQCITRDLGEKSKGVSTFRLFTGDPQFLSVSEGAKLMLYKIILIMYL